MVQLIVSTVSKPPSFAKGFPLRLDIAQGATVADVKREIAAKFPKFYFSRQKITIKGDRKALSDSTKVFDVVGKESGELQVKDLGPQISWRTVFLAEYFGPLLIHPIFYYFPKAIYGQGVAHSKIQNFVFAFVMLHFLKRELETLFVHHFSHDTMPALNIFKNSAHYWFLSGVLLAVDIYRPKYSAISPYIEGTIRDNDVFLWSFSALWAFAELSNLHTHLTLRSLRPPGTRVRKVPRGYGFNLVSFPNYFFESLGWLFIAAMTNSIGAWIFYIWATFVMSKWALDKHKNYKKEFGKEYPSGRKAIIPFIL